MRVVKGTQSLARMPAVLISYEVESQVGVAWLSGGPIIDATAAACGQVFGLGEMVGEAAEPAEPAAQRPEHRPSRQRAGDAAAHRLRLPAVTRPGPATVVAALAASSSATAGSPAPVGRTAIGLLVIVVAGAALNTDGGRRRQ